TEGLIAVVAFACFLAVCMVLGLCMSASARLKQGTLMKNTVLWRLICLLRRGVNGARRVRNRIFKRVWEIILAIPMIWRTALAVCVIVAYDIVMIFAMVDGEDVLGTVMFFAKAVILGFAALSVAFQMRRLQQGADALAQGNLAYKVDTEKMYSDFKKHGESLNGISKGMAVAVEERLQSERMKAELITNVSHDIKTPLTSIINYSGLICEENCENEKHREYSEVLLRKSEHLKRLLDDLVEISKANSGTLDVALLPCDAGVLLEQTAGEFGQKCSDARLTLVTSTDGKSARIMADSRRIWRVFENLMNNAVKYSLPDSRVYLSLESDEKEVRFIFRNTSRDTLDISPSELAERFVRGDASRSTEGNGLGLSIAKSLTELQNGKMEIFIDGDLFKVVLRFDKL
ncbi:MAG: sensor histidine kinase, partial [Clostridia bacterium]|nr:sensor histidine kinase [Clostridia bacterium]